MGLTSSNILQRGTKNPIISTSSRQEMNDEHREGKKKLGLNYRACSVTYSRKIVSGVLHRENVPARERFLGTFGGASLVYSNILTRCR